MIIRHSKKLLDQLSEVEDLIQKLEKYMDRCGLEVDREKILSEILSGQRVMNTPRPSADKN